MAAIDCMFCGVELDADRAEYLEETGRPKTCKFCSVEGHAVVLMEYGHKTAGTIVRVGTNPEQIRLASRAYRRAR
jgi:hypothetical protein